MSLSFKRTPEDFICEVCGTEVSGNGYTNHCPECLWSKHVDIHPGDREAACGGLMEPVGVEKKGDDYIIRHKCVVCGFERLNKAQKEDRFEMIVQISANDYRG